MPHLEHAGNVEGGAAGVLRVMNCLNLTLAAPDAGVCPPNDLISAFPSL